VLLSPGWREVAGLDESDDDRGKSDDEEASQRLPPLAPGQRLAGAFSRAQKRTRPPPRYTEAALLSAMEFAGREVEDDALRQALKERGLGTPATRASTIETLLRRGYLERQQKNLIPTALGASLIDLLPVRSLASPELTGEWEARLVRMARGEEHRTTFMSDIAKYVREIVEQVRTSPPPAPLSLAGRGGSGNGASTGGTSPPLAPLSLAGRGGSSRAGSKRGLRASRSTHAGNDRRGIVHDAGQFVEEGKLARERGAGGGEVPLHCPHCLDGRIIPGKRAWGCSRWKEGCRLVIPYEFGEKKLTAKQLHELITTGQTGRRATWKQDGQERKGKLLLDLQSDPPALRIQP
jgi:DNA topoisomerase-3